MRLKQFQEKWEPVFLLELIVQMTSASERPPFGDDRKIVSIPALTESSKETWRCAL